MDRGMRMHYNGGGGNHMFGGGEHHMFMFGHGIFMLLVLVAIAALVYYFCRKNCGKNNNNAINILRERYANGEISTDEYRERFDELTKIPSGKSRSKNSNTNPPTS